MRQYSCESQNNLASYAFHLFSVFFCGILLVEQTDETVVIVTNECPEKSVGQTVRFRQICNWKMQTSVLLYLVYSKLTNRKILNIKGWNFIGKSTVEINIPIQLMGLNVRIFAYVCDGFNRPSVNSSDYLESSFRKREKDRIEKIKSPKPAWLGRFCFRFIPFPRRSRNSWAIKALHSPSIVRGNIA